MKFIYVRATNIFSLGIRALEGGAASHVGIVDGDHVIEASFWHGVRRVPREKFLEHYTVVDEIEFSVPDEAVGIEWAHRQLGKPYDVTGVLGFLLWRNWSSDNRWYCSELAVGAALQAGRTLADRHPRMGVRLSRELAHAWRQR